MRRGLLPADERASRRYSKGGIGVELKVLHPFTFTVTSQGDERHATEPFLPKRLLFFPELAQQLRFPPALD